MQLESDEISLLVGHDSSLLHSLCVATVVLLVQCLPTLTR